MIAKLERENKLNDINNIQFGNDHQEIVSSLEILVMMLDVDDDKEVIATCKRRLQEGVELLKKININAAKDFEL